MSTWTEIIKSLSPEQIRELEHETLNSPILSCLFRRADHTGEKPIEILAVTCIELSKHAKKMEKIATETIALTPTRTFILPEM